MSTPHESAEKPMQFFYLENALYKSCAYVLCSLPVIILANYVTIVVVQQREITVFLGMTTIIAVLGLYVAQFLWPRYRICQRGLSQRNFLPVWDVWTWEDVASGQLSYQFETLTNPSRPWYCRKLYLLLENDDRQTVMSQLMSRYRPPLRPLMNPLTFQIKGLKSKTITLSDDGLTILKHGRTTHYAWMDVIRIELWNPDEYSEGFLNGIFVLADQTIRLRNGYDDAGNIEPGIDIDLRRYLDSHQISWVNAERS